GWEELTVEPVKQERLDDALSLAEMLTEIFLILGLFCMVAGLMLVVNIFVLLAEERKAEMGISRAIGLKRFHLTQTFVFEGVAYAAFAALVGALTGVVLAYIMIEAFNSIVASFFAEDALRLIFKFEWESILLGFGLGFLVTFLTVVLAAWRVSRLNIVRAIRDIPEPAPSGLTVPEAALGLFLLFIGALGTYLGLSSLSLLLVSASPCLMMLGAGILAMRVIGPRASFTAVGAGIIAWLLLPINVVEGAKGGIEVFVTTGVLLVTGAVLIVIFNSKPLLFVVFSLMRRKRSLAPVLKTAISYPMKKPLRTGLTLAMFALVIFTVTVISFMTEMQTSYVETSIKEQSGGYGVIGYTVSGETLVGAEERIASSPYIPSGSVAQVHEVCVVRTTIVVGGENVSYSVGGFEDAFFRENTFAFWDYESRFSSPAEVWEAVLEGEGVVVDGSAAEVAIEHDGPMRRFEVSPGEEIRIRNITGADVEVKVLGILEEALLFNGIFTTDEFVREHFMINRTNLFLFKLSENADPDAVSKGLEKEFWANGMETIDVIAVIEKVMQTANAIMRLLQVYLSLGLIVGIAGLGVVSLRAVVERRQEIGMLRAIGFSRRMILHSFLIEVSFIAILGILIGMFLGTALSYDLYIEYFEGKTEFHVPWHNLLLLLLFSYLATLLATSSPAVSASRVHPAEALRYKG
ncbi:MAG: FtsX-like permease family protein, partial [Candidatus Thermoplasmatota archaeon]